MLDKKFILPSAISFTGFLFLVSMDAVIKILGETYSVLQLLFLNALFSLIPLLFFICKNHGFHFYKNQNYTFQVIRGIVHTIGFLFVLKGVLLLPLSVVYPVLFTSPLMLLVMSHFFLSDNINIIRVLAILIGFLGVVISAEPFGTNIVSALGVLYVFLGAFCIAITHLITRKYNYLTSSYSAAFFDQSQTLYSHQWHQQCLRGHFTESSQGSNYAARYGQMYRDFGIGSYENVDWASITDSNLADEISKRTPVANISEAQVDWDRKLMALLRDKHKAGAYTPS